MAYFAELEEDEALKNHIQKQVSQSKWAIMADKTARFGRRKGWYALVRIIKPGIVIETGVDKGLGACLITSALMKNTAEGYPGHYYGTDINPKAGYLLTDNYKNYGEVLYGDSIESLKAFQKPIDIFINDSDHSADYEAEEYETIKDKLSPAAIILGDNSHGNDKLLNFSIKYQRHFLFFKEQPANHWCPGEGIGISFTR
ncbi:MAG: class I SAM-dependent methyltransferase [Methylococcales bacterium]|nr:class I SAM-dependent methyltransferase [Methylococcales bacterium]